MADKEGFEVDQLGVIEGTSFSQILYDVEHEVLSLQVNDYHHQSDQTQVFNYSNADLKSPKMLCFGDFENKEHSNNTLPSGLPEVAIFRPVVTCSDSSSSVSSKPNNKKRNEPVQEKALNTKKPKIDKPSAGKKREKLGERIVALQQLVSPFGKTDTASVLHEALGYIRFLQDQVQVLCSPYLQCLPSLSEGAEKKGCDDLRSRGLCLVPVDYTKHVANNNGADYWSSSSTTMATSNHNVSSATGY